jgi:hydrogenase maturation factor
VTCEHGHCITCSDEGIEMTVLRAAGETAVCRDPDGGAADVDVALVDAVAPGDVVLVHAGVALARLEEAR